MSVRNGKLIMVILVVLATVGVFFVDPIAQDQAYHKFTDNTMQFGIPHFWNVVSNLPFLVVGLLGLLQLDRMNHLKSIRRAYQLWFFGVAMVAFGSAYYHLLPYNGGLLWDRLPMTIAFMSLFAIILSEFIDEKTGRILLWPLIIAGMASVFYWQYTESLAHGDLRFYALIQFLPMLLIPIILLFYRSRFSHVAGYWWLLLFYVLAKLLEYFDSEIFQLTNHFMAGHALKHISAAFGVWLLLVHYKKRRVLK